MADAKKSDWWRTRAVRLGGFAALSVAILGVRFAFDVGEGTWYGRLVEQVAFAFLVAALLGLSIDFLLKHDLVEDSFRAAIGYLLPEELRPELAWIHSLPFIATCTVDFEIHRMVGDPTHVTVTERMARHLRNVTKSRQLVHPSVGLDEWFYPGHPSNVVKFTCSIGSRKWELAGMRQNRNPKDATFGVETDKQWVDPGEECVITTELTQIRSVSDQAFDFFASPTSRTTITVRADEDFAFSVAPQHREAARDLGNGVFELDKTLLPGQVIRVRWWEKQAMEVWVAQK